MDVDALWARLNTALPKAPSPLPANAGKHNEGAPSGLSQQPKKPPLIDTNQNPSQKAQVPYAQLPSEDTIAIKRTYVFAGETITEEKIVPRSSAEARLYLQSQSTQPQPISPLGGKPLRRPKKRPSMFEPNPEGIVKGLAPTPNKGPKLNVVEKSKLDWASHVDQEGLKEELDVAEKAKGGYMGRMDFLGRTEAKREEDLKNVTRK